MNTHLLGAAVAAAFALLLPAAPAQAVNIKSFVSSTGSDVNDCSFATPCLSFQRAHDQTSAGGQIACLDSGEFLSATITKSITIDCAGTSATAFFFTVNGAGIVVTLRNLTLFGVLGVATGIDFLNGAALFVENCIIKDMTFNDALAIRFRPSAPGSQLVVSDTIIQNNGHLSTGGGIQVAPQPGGSAGVVLNRVQFGFNVTALALQSFNGAIGAVMRDSVVSSSRSNGILSLAGTGTSLKIERSSLVNNVGKAIQSSGANSLVRIGGSEITGNQIGLSADTGGQILSYQNNEINGNGTDGAPTGVLTLK